MGLRDLFRTKVAEPPQRERLPGTDELRVKAEGDVSFTPALIEILTMFDGTSASYGTIYRKLPPVRTVVDFIADSVASTPLKFYRREDNGRPEERDHRIARLLRKPNPNLTTRSLIWGTVADRAVYGRAYWRFVPATRANPVDSLIPLPPYRITPKGGDLVSPAAYEMWMPDGSAPVTFSAAEIIDFHGYDPEDRRIGASKLQALKAVLEEEVEASRNRRGYWANSARVGGWFFPEEMLTDDQLQVMQESIKGYAGAGNSGKVGISPVKGRFDPSSFSPRDSEFIQGRQFVLEATARIYNLPLPLLSLTTSVAYASQREHKRQLYTEVLPPWYEEITSEIELQLFPWFTDTEELYAEFTAEAKLRGDFLEQAEILTKAIGRPWMVVTEGRSLVNLDNRGVATDDEMAVPVGPNLALEGMAEQVQALPAQQAEQPGQLAVVASMPEEGLRRELVSFFDRQQQTVVPKIKAGEEFHFERWNRQLAPLLGKEIAERINLRTAVALAGGQDPEDVFDELRAYALEMARVAMSKEETA